MTRERKVVVAIVLWLALSVVVWNVVFDRLLVLAGRRYVHAAAAAVRDTDTYIKINDWMRPAITRSTWTATISAAGVAVLGLGALAWAARRGRER